MKTFDGYTNWIAPINFFKWQNLVIYLCRKEYNTNKKKSNISIIPFSIIKSYLISVQMSLKDQIYPNIKVVTK